MSTLPKVLAGLVVALPLGVFVASSLTSSAQDVPPRERIVITDDSGSTDGPVGTDAEPAGADTDPGGAGVKDGTDPLLPPVDRDHPAHQVPQQTAGAGGEKDRRPGAGRDDDEDRRPGGGRVESDDERDVDVDDDDDEDRRPGGGRDDRDDDDDDDGRDDDDDDGPDDDREDDDD